MAPGRPGPRPAEPRLSSWNTTKPRSARCCQRRRGRPLVVHRLHAGAAVDHHDHGVASAGFHLPRLEERAVERVPPALTTVTISGVAQPSAGEIGVGAHRELAGRRAVAVAHDGARRPVRGGMHVDPTLAARFDGSVVRAGLVTELDGFGLPDSLAA